MTDGTTTAGPTTTDKTAASLRRYRVMAWVTGVFLLILVVEMLVRYVIQPGPDVLRWIEWIPYAHGWIYVLYLVTVVDLWGKVRWGFGRLAALVFAGVVPVLSFVVEAKVHREVSARLAAAPQP
ncbi:MAG: DUF3817 domain-containing protein [Actinomycetota bacterium]|nr:DUF3817 domain-containing protein [Actinomycetota bacterium]